MHRPRYAIGFLLAPVLFALVFTTFGCGAGGPEQNNIQKFFQSSRLRDNVTLGGMALVAFNPTTDGIVEFLGSAGRGPGQQFYRLQVH